MLVWWSRDREGQRGKPCEFSGADSSCVLFPRGGGGGNINKEMEGSEQRKGTQRCPVVNFFPRVHSHGSRWPIHRGLDLRKQLLPGPRSNSWGYRTPLHRLHARNQWVPLCPHAYALMSRLMPYARLEQRTRKNNSTHFGTRHLQMNGKTQY